MEHQFYNDYFERLLRQKTDEFRMLPTKTLWYSIYNDLHPGKKWPSITMSFVIITLIGCIGYFNTSSNKYNGNEITAINKTVRKGDPALLAYTNNNQVKLLTVNQQQPAGGTPTLATTKYSHKNRIGNEAAYTKNNIQQSNNNSQADNDILNQPINTVLITNYNVDQNFKSLPSLKEAGTFVFTEEKSKILSTTTQAEASLPIHSKELNFGDLSTLKLKESHLKNRTSYRLYVTPSVSFRKLEAQSEQVMAFNNNGIQSDINTALNHQPSIGLETGAELNYMLTTNIYVKSGLQLNYTSYSVTAFPVNHPMVSSLMLSDANSGQIYLDPRVSTFTATNGSQPSKLYNKTYQVSIPVGVGVKLAGNEQLKWYASTSIQPTFVLGGKAYLISADRKNYIEDAFLMRRWNVNTAIETFLTYKTKENIQLQFGPQYRYQLTSTYSKEYSINEHLYQLGIKLGLLKTF